MHSDGPLRDESAQHHVKDAAWCFHEDLRGYCFDLSILRHVPMAADLRVDPPDRAPPSESAGLPLVGAGIRTWASCLCTLILIKLPFSLDIMPFEAWMMTGLLRGQVGVLRSCLQCNSRDNETCLLFKYCFFYSEGQRSACTSNSNCLHLRWNQHQ